MNKNFNMTNLSLIKDIEIEESIKEPYLAYFSETIIDRKKVAYSLLNRKKEDILLIASPGFLIDSVFAGLTEEHIEYIALNGPRGYKENLIKILQDEKMMEGVFEIVKSIDEDLGQNIKKNQDRIKNILQYIKDNIVVFKF